MFKDREEAGALLADELAQYKDAVVLAIPRGGLPVAHVISQKLSLPLDVLMVKKLGFPDDKELAIGAVGAHAVELNSLARHVPESYIKENVKRLQKDIHLRTRFLRGNRPPLYLKGKTVILVDDGVATGATMILAVHIIRTQHPKEIIIAVPVSPAETLPQLENVADEVVCLKSPWQFNAVGAFYEDYHEVDDETAHELLG